MTSSNPSHKAPVLFLMWNRPDCVSKSFRRIRTYQPYSLYVAADGPPQHDNECSQSIIECKQIVDELLDWDCKVNYLYRNKNLGCRNAISSAIDWFFENEEYGIIVEDDVVLEDSFFVFAEQLLHMYQFDSSVGMVSANCFNPSYASPYSYSFSIHPHIWGWGTWRRVWNDYDPNIQDFNLLRSFIQLFSRFGFLPALFWSYTFYMVKTQRTNTWDYQLTYLFYSKNLISAIPSFEQSENMGFGLNATHTSNCLSPLSPSKSLPMPLSHPPTKNTNWYRDRRTMYTNFIPTLTPQRILNLLIKVYRLHRQLLSRLNQPT